MFAYLVCRLFNRLWELQSKRARCASLGSLRSPCVRTALINVQCTLLKMWAPYKTVWMTWPVGGDAPVGGAAPVGGDAPVGGAAVLAAVDVINVDKNNNDMIANTNYYKYQ